MMTTDSLLFGLRFSSFPLWLGFWLAALAFVHDSLADSASDVPEMLGQKRVIGATALLQIAESGLEFKARVDTGAKSCSLHVEKWEIENESEDMAENMHKPIRFLVKDQHGKEAWIESKIVSRVLVKNSKSTDRRYKVRLILRWKGFEKRVRVTLNDRSDMEFPLLLGRNFLQDDFVVDVSLDNDEKHRQ